MFSFFFWMDFIGTLSILLDVGWLKLGVLDSIEGRWELLRAARIAKIGARSSRLMRYVSASCVLFANALRMGTKEEKNNKKKHE